MRTSNMKISYRIIILLLICVFVGGIYLYKSSRAASYANTSSSAGSSLKLRLIDYGSKPCKCQPKPLLYETLEVKYASSVYFEYVDMLSAAKKDIQIIPTQVIYDANSKEIARHEGVATDEVIKDLIETAEQALASLP